jgi:amino acid transporter
MSLFMGLVYGELGTILPHSGGDFTYIRKGLGSLPAFLAVWIIPLFSNTGSMAVLSLVFADYLLAFLFGSCSPAGAIRQLIAALVILTLCITNVVSVRIGAYTQIICTVAKTLALIIISGSGIVFLAKGSVENLNDAFEGSSTHLQGYAIAIYNCMFAYSGYIRIAEIAEELKNPTRNIPRAICISVIAVTIIYVMTNISYFVLLPKIEFLQSSAVAYDWALKGIKPIAFLIPISVMLSVYGANNGGGFGTGRILFSAARAGQLPVIFSNLHVTTSVPVVSIVGMHILSVVFLISNDIAKLINFLSFISFVIIFLSTLSLLRLRYQQRFERKDKNRFQTPLFCASYYMFNMYIPNCVTICVKSKSRILV